MSCFFYGRVVAVVVIIDRPRFSAVDVQLCAEGNGDFVYPVDTHTHTHLFFDASLRRHASVGWSVGCVWFLAEKTRCSPLNTGGRPATVVCLLVIGVSHWFVGLFDDSSFIFFLFSFFWYFLSQFKIVKCSFQNDPPITFLLWSNQEKNNNKKNVPLFYTLWHHSWRQCGFSYQFGPVGAKLSG